MKTLDNIKSITGKVIFHGKGSINNDSTEQKYILGKLGLLTGKTYDNVTFHKKMFFNDGESNKFRYKVSNNAIRSAMFSDKMAYYNNAISKIPQVFLNTISTPEMVARGYMYTEGIVGKKKGSFTITDAVSNDVQEVVALDVQTHAGERNDTSLFYRENVGEHEYTSSLGIDFCELQFIPLDDVYDRNAAKIPTKEFFDKYLANMKENFGTGEEVEKKPYYLSTSIMGEEGAEEGILLSRKMVNKAVHTILDRIIGVKINRPSLGGEFIFKSMSLNVNYSDGTSEDIEISSKKDIEDIFFGYAQVYLEADEERIRKRDEDIKRMNEKKKSKEDE